jgi:phage gp29-like protein
MELRNPGLIPGVTAGKRRPNGGGIDWAPPNQGQYPVRHVDTFINRYTSLSNVYRDSDEALLDSRDNARFMRNDIGIRECLDSRQRSVALLNWHLAPEDDRSHDQQEFCKKLEKAIRSISHFTEYRRNAQHAIWFGKYGIQHSWGIKPIAGRSWYVPLGRHQDDWGWRPLNGDKIVFRQLRADAELPAGSYEGQMGIRVGYRYQPGQIINNRWKVEPTDYGLAYFLSPAERRLMLVHKHHIEDASYDDGLRAGSIHGVGIRSVIYWEWFQAKETMAFLMEFIGRMAGGIQVWKYPLGNEEARKQTIAAAENYNSEQEHVVLVPVPAGDVGQYGVEIIDPGFQGIDTLHQLLTTYFGHRIKRYIMGQILTSEAEATGMGSGVAELHADTYLQILKSDSIGHEETMTSDLVASIIKINVARRVIADPGFLPRFTVETEEADVDKISEAWGTWADRGLKLDTKALYELIGAAMPTSDDIPFQSTKAGGGAQPGEAQPGMGGDPNAPQQAGDDASAMGPPAEPTEPQPKPADGSPSRYAKDSDGEKWITIGGSAGESGKHEGGAHVKIDGSGKITAGPAALAKKGIQSLSDFGKTKKPQTDIERANELSGQAMSASYKANKGIISHGEAEQAHESAMQAHMAIESKTSDRSEQSRHQSLRKMHFENVRQHRHLAQQANSPSDVPSVDVPAVKPQPKIDREEMESSLQMYQDAIQVKKSKGDQVPQKWIDSMADIVDRLKGKEPETGLMASNQVFGHPESTADQTYSNLIPIRVGDMESIVRKTAQAQKLLDDLSSKLAMAEWKVKNKKKNPKEAKIAAAYLDSENGRTDAQNRDLIRNETMPELSRLRYEMKKREPNQSVPTEQKQPSNYSRRTSTPFTRSAIKRQLGLK